jgi:hypothetical protein
MGVKFWPKFLQTNRGLILLDLHYVPEIRTFNVFGSDIQSNINTPTKLRTPKFWPLRYSYTINIEKNEPKIVIVIAKWSFFEVGRKLRFDNS